MSSVAFHPIISSIQKIALYETRQVVYTWEYTLERTALIKLTLEFLLGWLE